MKVMYSCTPCGILRAPIEVPDREEGEDIVHWVGTTVAEKIGEDHSLRSPECRERAISEVWIPTDGEVLGKSPKN